LIAVPPRRHASNLLGASPSPRGLEYIPFPLDLTHYLCHKFLMMSTENDAKSVKKMGRPFIGAMRVGIRVPPKLYEEIDEWRATQRPIPSMQMAIRMILECYISLALLEARSK
jgi:hypothetical protein